MRLAIDACSGECLAINVDTSIAERCSISIGDMLVTTEFFDHTP
jgi:hypothetical protein